MNQEFATVVQKMLYCMDDPTARSLCLKADQAMQVSLGYHETLISIWGKSFPQPRNLATLVRRAAVQFTTPDGRDTT